MYDEAADFAEHVAQIREMDTVLANAGASIDWPRAVACDVGGGGGLRAALLCPRVARAHCADVIDQQARYGGEFVKLLAEKLERHGHKLPLERFEANVTDAMNLIYRDELFDFVCSVNAFEHIPDPARALEEIARVLKPGGIAYISFDPIWTADTGSHFAHRVPEPWAHLVLSEDEFIARLREKGAEEWEVGEFRGAMNRVPLSRFREMLGGDGLPAGLRTLHSACWKGVASEEHVRHAFFARALERHTEEEIMTRGMACVLAKNG